MHETTIAESLCQAICEQAERLQARPTSATMSCGQLNAINDEVLRFAFDAVAAGTPCEGVRLIVQHKPLQARCNQCKQPFNVDLDKPYCTHCGSDDFRLLPDAPIVLEQIEFQKE